VFIAWAWAASHGLWFVGVIVGFVVVAALAVERRGEPLAVGRLALVPLLSLGASALTPAGPKLLLAPLTISGYTGFIREWDPPDIREPRIAVTFLLAVILVVIWARISERTALTDLALALLGMAWCLMYTRTVALGAVMLAPLTAGAIQGVLAHRLAPPRRVERATLWTTTTAALLIAAALGPGFAARPGYMPDGLSARIGALPQGTVVFNDFGLGGWMLWRHRNVIPVIDGRIEVYDTAYVQTYLNAREAKAGWEGTIAASGARYAVMEDSTALADALEQHLQWRRVAEDRNFVLLEAPGAN
jgi:hypothetical protein